MTRHNTIYTLPVLRNEFRALRDLKRERKTIIKGYTLPLKTLGDKLYKTKQDLEKIKSPGISDGLGGFVKDDNYNYLIQYKDELKDEIQRYIWINYSKYWEDMCECNARIATVYYYLGKMNAMDRKFIEDFYINEKLNKREVMERYNILNPKSLYRKADNIFRKLL